MPTFMNIIIVYTRPTNAKIRVLAPPKILENCALPLRYSPELYLPKEAALMKFYIFIINI